MAEDISNQRFGKLIAIRPTGEKRNNSPMWECQCDCGNVVSVQSSNLRSGHTQSCGCIRAERRAKDLTGQRFGKLVALRPTDMRKNNQVVWECACDCGSTAFVASYNLQVGRETSCGCEKKGNMPVDLTGQRFGKLVALHPTEERKRGRVVWECLCDCGNTALVAADSLKRKDTTSCGCAYKDYLAKEIIKDLTGQRFGRLVALEPEEERKNGQVVWKCKCDCGNTVSVRGANLRNGHTMSCGSCPKEDFPHPGAKDLTGLRFGKLVAMRPTGERKNGFVMWECACDCGKTTIVRGSSLTGGYVKSCGCLQRTNNHERAKDLAGQRFGRLTVLRLIENRSTGRKTWECQCDCGNTKIVKHNSLISGNTKSCGCLKKDSLTKANGKDLTGQRFGKLSVLRATNERKNGQIVWECLCDCGNTVLAGSSSLRRGEKTSCGCTYKTFVWKDLIKDLTGQRFGNLVAIEPEKERKNGQLVWKCKCDCGNIVLVRGANLRNGHTKSCGCTRGKRAKEV